MNTVKAVTAEDFSPYRIAEFWSKTRLTVNGCLEWEGCADSGYGRVEMRGSTARSKRRVLAHRAAYAMTWGHCPGDKKVMHSCDNPRCVNPGHLSLGTQADNVADMVAKGRSRFYGNVPRGKV